MIRKQKDRFIWHEFDLLQDLPVIHACTTKHGGFSEGDLASLNIGKNVGDDPITLSKNWNVIKDALSIPKILSAKLSHGNTVSMISSDIDNVPISDGVSTKIIGLGLAISQADCQGAIFYDPINHAISNVHSGWRGSVQNIYASTIDHMKNVYGTDPKDLIVCISPSLGPKNAEFKHYKSELPESFWQFQEKPAYFDFWQISRWQLRCCNVLDSHIEIASIDTYENEQDYFSYRKNNACGRQATLCMLR